MPKTARPPSEPAAPSCSSTLSEDCRDSLKSSTDHALPLKKRSRNDDIPVASVQIPVPAAPTATTKTLLLPDDQDPDDMEHPDCSRATVRPRVLKPAPFFFYEDYSQERDDDPLTPLTPMARVPNFPAKMHAILARKDLQDIIAWMPHGRSWKILKPREFEIRVLPTYFDHAKFSSFIRQANGWGFRRITQGTDRNAYYHERFLRGLPHLCKRMRRPAVSEKASVNPDHEPDFYEISKKFPVPLKAHGDDDSILLEFTVTGGPKARMPVHGGLVPPRVNSSESGLPDSKLEGWMLPAALPSSPMISANLPQIAGISGNTGTGVNGNSVSYLLQAQQQHLPTIPFSMLNSAPGLAAASRQTHAMLPPFHAANMAFLPHMAYPNAASMPQVSMQNVTARNMYPSTALHQDSSLLSQEALLLQILRTQEEIHAMNVRSYLRNTGQLQQQQQANDMQAQLQAYLQSMGQR